MKSSTLGRIPWYLVLVFIALAVGITLTGYLLYSNQSRNALAAQRQELNAVAELKVSEIVRWRAERMGDGQVILRNPSLGQSVTAFFQEPQREDLRQPLQYWLDTFLTVYDYDTAQILDTDGIVRLAVPEDRFFLNPNLRERALAVLQTRQVEMTDFFISAVDGKIYLAILAPIYQRSGVSSEPVGVIVLLINPYRYIYPFIQSWPNAASQTAESLLVRRDGDQVLYLNNLRYKKDAALKMRLPITSMELPAARAVLGDVSLTEGVDYRGVHVLTAIRAIPGSPWVLIAKSDRQEVEAPIQLLGWRVFWVSFFLILSSAVLVGVLWRQETLIFVTRQYADELERKALSQHYDSLTRYAYDAILLLDAGGLILEANDRAVAFYGYSLQELLQMNLSRVQMPPGQTSQPPDRLSQYFETAREQGGVLFEETHWRKNNTSFPVEISLRCLQIEGKDFYQSIVRDISERKRAEEAEQEAERRLNTLVDNLIGVAYRCRNDADWTMEYISEGCWDLTGYSRQELIANRTVSFGKLIIEADRDRVVQVIQVALDQHESYMIDYRLKTRSGEEKWVAEKGRGVYTPAGELVALEGFISDVSEQKLAEEQIRHLNQSLETQVEERTKQLTAANHELESFTYSVSHDLRAPLRSMYGFSQALAEDYGEQLDAAGRDYLQRIQSASQRMSVLIDDLLRLSRVTRSEIRYATCDLSRMAAQIANELRDTAPERQVEFVIQPGLLAQADEGLLHIVLQNLMGNAWKFTSHHPAARIEVGGWQEDHGAPTFFVRDDGAGFDMAYAQKLFGTFQRLHSAQQFEGTGVGLALAQRIILKHGGSIWAKSMVEQGAVFYFTLPGMGEENEA